MSSVRILLAGDVQGHLDALLKRVVSVNKKNGPFEALFCVGQFFPVDPGGIEEVQGYIDGQKQIPIPTYFIGDYGEGVGLLLSASRAKASKSGHPMEGISVCHNLFWLKGSGIVNIHGLRVAYLGGKYVASLYEDSKGAAAAGAHHEDDVDALRASAEEKAVTDLFLSNEWPLGVTVGAIVEDSSSVDKSTGTTVTAELAAALKPRYHIAGTEGVHYAREPYVSKGATHCTRFIGLAAVGNNQQQKFLHALSLVPAAVSSASDLAQKYPNSTFSPYEGTTLVSNEKDGWVGAGNGTGRGLSGTANRQGAPEDQDSYQQYWRYDTTKSKRQKADDGDKVCFEFVTKGTCSREGNCRFRHEFEDGAPIPKGFCFDLLSKGQCTKGPQCRYQHSRDETPRGGDPLPPGVCFAFFKTGTCEKGAECRFSHDLDNPAPPPKPTGPCWFCLSSPDVSSHLVVSVGDHCYCALAKGAIMQGHVLLLPIEHFPSLVSLPADSMAEVNKFKAALRECYESQGNTIISFERYIQLRAGTHAHLQVFPVPLLRALGAREAFVSAAKQEGFEFQEIPPGQSMDDSRQALKKIVQDKNYFFAELSDGAMLVLPLEGGSKMSMQFGREVVARIVGQPEKANWKACTLSKEEETVMAEEFKSKFSSFDPMS